VKPALLIAALALGAAASPRPQAPAPEPSVENLYWVAACLLQHDAHDFDRSLSIAPGGRDSRRAQNIDEIWHCYVPQRPVLTPTYIGRGAMAELLLYRDFPSVGAAPRRHAVPVFAPVSRDYLARADEHSRRMLAALDLTSCVTRREPAKVYAFFGTARGSAAERAAMVELTPAISACLVEGQTFDMAPPLFRAFLAEGAYRVAAGQPNVYETSP
jgi:hypothetical protein